jgi:hypothetical protein
MSHKETANQHLLPQYQFPEEHIENHEDTWGLKSRQNRDTSFVLYNGWQFDNRRLIQLLTHLKSAQEPESDGYTLADGSVSAVKTIM